MDARNFVCVQKGLKPISQGAPELLLSLVLSRTSSNKTSRTFDGATKQKTALLSNDLTFHYTVMFNDGILTFHGFVKKSQPT